MKTKYGKTRHSYKMDFIPDKDLFRAVPKQFQNGSFLLLPATGKESNTITLFGDM